MPAIGAANTVLQVNAAGNGLEYEKVKALNVDINAATDTVITASDEIWFGDATDSNLVKKDKVQGILDLVPASASGWVPIKTVTASSSATVDFVNGSGGVVLDGTYTAYAVRVTYLVPATDATSLWYRTSTDGGSTYDAGASDYDYVGTVNNSSSGVASDVNSTGAAQIVISSPTGNDTLESLGGIIYIDNPAGTRKATVNWFMKGVNQNGNTYYHLGSGARLAGANVDAIRFLMSSGNITSGTFTLYGLASAA